MENIHNQKRIRRRRNVNFPFISEEKIKDIYFTTRTKVFEIHDSIRGLIPETKYETLSHQIEFSL